MQGCKQECPNWGESMHQRVSVLYFPIQLQIRKTITVTNIECFLQRDGVQCGLTVLRLFHKISFKLKSKDKRL